MIIIVEYLNSQSKLVLEKHDPTTLNSPALIQVYLTLIHFDIN